MARPPNLGRALRALWGASADSAAESGTPGTLLPRVPWLPLSGRSRLLLIVASLGPGLVAANAGNDAGGIATYASTGASYGYSLLWVFPLILISLGVVQEMAARMGAATGKGLADLIRETFPLHVTAVVMLALFISNGATVVSEFVGIAAAISLLPVHPWVKYLALPLVALSLWLLVVRGNYSSVEKVFLAMTLPFFAYPISAILGHPNWGLALHDTVVPSFHMQSAYLITLIALIGTSITPYMQVYVQSAVVEKGVTPRDYLPERIGVYGGSIFAMLTAAFIVIATAATLFLHHEQVSDAAAAARALQPLAGQYAELLFGIGLFGASVLAAAVLPLATAYSITEALGVEKGVSLGFREAPIFMGLFTGLMVVGVLVALVISPAQTIQLLIYIQVINGVLLPFVLFSILRLVNDRSIMGDMTNGHVYNVIAWATAIIVGGVSIVYLSVTILQAFGVGG